MRRVWHVARSSGVYEEGFGGEGTMVMDDEVEVAEASRGAVVGAGCSLNAGVVAWDSVEDKGG
jgi:hypothetical protein